MSRQNQIDAAIARLQLEIEVRQQAIDALRNIKQKPKMRVVKSKPAKEPA